MICEGLGRPERPSQTPSMHGQDQGAGTGKDRGRGRTGRRKSLGEVTGLPSYWDLISTVHILTLQNIIKTMFLDMMNLV